MWVMVLYTDGENHHLQMLYIVVMLVRFKEGKLGMEV